MNKIRDALGLPIVEGQIMLNPRWRPLILLSTSGGIFRFAQITEKRSIIKFINGNNNFLRSYGLPYLRDYIGVDKLLISSLNETFNRADIYVSKINEIESETDFVFPKSNLKLIL